MLRLSTRFVSVSGVFGCWGSGVEVVMVDAENLWHSLGTILHDSVMWGIGSDRLKFIYFLSGLLVDAAIFAIRVVKRRSQSGVSTNIVVQIQELNHIRIR